MAYEIVNHEQFSENTFLWEVDAPDVARAAQPGQFIMLRLRKGGERIPLTVADFDREKGTITMVIQAIGKTTQEMLERYGKNDRFTDFVGPLGLKAEIEPDAGHVVLIGGGLGVAPIYPQVRAFKEAGNRVTAIIGFRTKDLVFWEERFRPWCDELIVCTDDGSYGRKGFVTSALADLLESDRPDRVVAIGPLPMMRACAETTREAAVPTIVSLNAIMVDATGMCGSCRVTVDNTIRFACVDGPEFDAHQVDFGELMARQARFKPQESFANKDYERVCNLEQKLFVENKRNYKKLKGLPPHATPMPERDAHIRVKNFKEVNLGYTMNDALAEAERCIQCVKPTCIDGCPVEIDIPKFIRHLLIRDMTGALEAIQDANVFPSVCGRVCPQESQCEAQCVVGRKYEAVAIGRLERFVGDFAVSAPPRKSKGTLGKVAIVGSGPAGLACAADLAKLDADVTVYEALHVVGGVLAYGIPSFRLPRETISREVERLQEMGVKILTNKVIGMTFTIDQLRNEMGFDAVFVATGAGFPSFLGIDGEGAGGVLSANEFLTRINLMGGDRFPWEDTPVNLGNKVIVLGGGNTAMDCTRVARRAGAEHVMCVYRRTEAQAPARVEELRHAREEGVDFHFLRSPLEIYTDEAGDVCGMRTQVMELGPPDDSGRQRPIAVEGEIEMFECDTVIYALGTKANPIIARTTADLKTQWGDYIVADGLTQATSLEGVFAGGDIVSGGATVILAMGAGRRAAKAIGVFLNEGQWPPYVEPPPEKKKKKKKKKKAAPVAPPPKTCSRCRRPLVDDEDYVCCADSLLTWSCNDCGKVYDGFAFPFGMCAACGGTLNTDHVVDDADAKVKQAIREAMEIELGGRAFYAEGSQRAGDPVVIDLLKRLSDMENEHVDLLVRRYHLPDSATADAPSISQVAIFVGVEVPEDSEELLRLAVKLEERARDTFRDRQDEFEEGTAAWKLYRELAAEEQEHVELLTVALRGLKTGRPGLL